MYSDTDMDTKSYWQGQPLFTYSNFEILMRKIWGGGGGGNVSKLW